MDYPIYNKKAENVGKVELPDNVFNLKMNSDLLHQVVTSKMSIQRQVFAHAKGRAVVRGGGKKPWRQKGTGRARHGSIRSPIWKGGGVTFGPTKERNFKKKINIKMARKAMFVALSSKVNDNQLLILDNMEMDKIKTKEIASMYKKVMQGKTGKTLFVTPVSDNKIKLSARNLQGITTIEARNLNALNILSHKNLLLLKDSIMVLSEMANKK